MTSARQPYGPERGVRSRVWPARPPPRGREDVEERAAAVDIARKVADQLREVADADEAHEIIARAVAGWAHDQLILRGVMPSEAAQARLIKAVIDDRYGFGPLTEFIEDANVEEIAANGFDQTFIWYRDGTKVPGPAIAASDEEMIERIRLWGVHEGTSPREFSHATPMINVAVGDDLRLSATMSVTRRPCLDIRRHGMVEVTLRVLERAGTIDAVLRAFLAAAVKARRTTLVSGGVRAGKTTMLRALASEIDPTERVITLETDYELFLDLMDGHPDVVAFQERAPNSEGVGGQRLHDMIPQSLRMNPDRLIVGEVRDREITPMLEAMMSGQEGSLSTIHANAAGEVFNRILLLAHRGALAMPAESVHLLSGLAIDLVVHIHRDRTNRRYVSEVLEVLPPADGSLPTTNRIFRPGRDGRAVPATTPACLDRLVEAGFDPSLLDHRDGLWRTP